MARIFTAESFVLKKAAALVYPQFFFASIMRPQVDFGPYCVISFDCDFPRDIEVLPRLVALLKEYKVDASFACIGEWVRKYPDPHRLLVDEGEIAGIRKLTEYPRLIEAAAQAMEPHRLAFYLYDLAQVFHAHWNRGTDNPDLRFVKVNDPQLTHARLGLVQAVSDVLTSGLALVGAEAPAEMR